MKRFITTVCLLGLIAVAITGCSQGQKPSSDLSQLEGDPVGRAKAWLAIVDQGKYAESWPETCEFFRGLVSRDQLVQTLTSVRKPMGELVSRKMASATPSDSMPGAPDGKYVVITFNTEFSNKKNGIETLTVMMDDDWRVAGYYIK